MGPSMRHREWSTPSAKLNNFGETKLGMVTEYVLNPPHQDWIEGVASWGSEAARHGKPFQALAYGLASIALSPLSESQTFISGTQKLTWRDGWREKLAAKGRAFYRGAAVVALALAPAFVQPISSKRETKRVQDHLIREIN